MATYSFTRLSSGTVKVVADGNTYFIPGDCKVNPEDSLNRIIITDRYGAKITMDSELDTINIAGIANTGTATEIAEDLATDIFFLASSGGGVSYSDDPATFTGSTLQINNGTANAWGAYLFSVEAENSAAVGAYTDTSSCNITIYNEDGGAPNELDINSSHDMVLYSGNGSGATLALKTNGTVQLSTLPAHADDAAAAIGGVPVGGLYHTSGALKIRLA